MGVIDVCAGYAKVRYIVLNDRVEMLNGFRHSVMQARATQMFNKMYQWAVCSRASFVFTLRHTKKSHE